MEKLPFKASIDPEDGRVWVRGGSRNGFFSALKGRDGVWNSAKAPSADELMNDFERVTDEVLATKYINEALAACSL